MTIDTYTISDSGKASIVKDPNAVLDYSLDLSAWLTDAGDALQSLDVIGDGVTIDSHAISGTAVIAWVSGGTAGESATVTYRFTTANGRTDDRSITLKIRER
jgi:hypothetical protein